MWYVRGTTCALGRLMTLGAFLITGKADKFERSKLVQSYSGNRASIVLKLSFLLLSISE